MKRNIPVVILFLLIAHLSCSKKVCGCGPLDYDTILSSELMSATWQLISSYQYDGNSASFTKTAGTIADTAWFGYVAPGYPSGTYKNFSFFSGNIKTEYTIGVKDSLIVLTTPWKGIYSDTLRVLNLDTKYLSFKVRKANDPNGGYEIDSLKKIRLYY